MRGAAKAAATFELRHFPYDSPGIAPARNSRPNLKLSLATLRGGHFRPAHACYCGLMLDSGLPSGGPSSPVVSPSDGMVLATGPRRAAPFQALLRASPRRTYFTVAAMLVHPRAWRPVP